MMSAINGTDYINRYAVLNVIDDAVANNALSYEDGINTILRFIAKIPAADVREVVTCGECKYWRGDGTICKGIGIDFDADGFCCEGEKKEVDDGNR